MSAPVRVLLVEDSADDAELVLRALVRGGFEPRAERVDTAEALGAALAAGGWDVVLTDHALPGFGAPEVLAAAHARDESLPCIMVSGRIGEEAAAAAMRAGAVDYVSKDQLARLPAAVHRALREASERAARRAAEAARAAAEAQLRDALADLEALVRASPVAIVAVDAGGRVVRWSAAAEALFRRPAGEALGRPLVQLEPGLAGVLVSVLMAEPSRAAATVAARFERAGEFVDASVSAAALRGADGLVRGAVAMVADRTEEQGLRAKLVMADRLVAMGTLAAGVAHEINNPLTYLLTNLDTLGEQLAHAGVRPDTLETLREARDGAARVRAIVAELRAFSRADDAQRAPLDVRAVLDTAVHLAHSAIRFRATLRREYTAVPLVLANEGRLAQVFLNLLVNAAQAIPEGHAAEHEVTVCVRSGPGVVIAEVRDTGVGISREVVGRIFDPFFTTKPVGFGTGLGLSISHGIVAALGGSIEVESEPGCGSTFRVTLPAAPPVREITRPPPLASAAVSPAGVRVLIVDDDRLVARALGRALRGCAVTVRHSVREALELLARERFDLIFTDVMMPEVSGIELHARLARLRPGDEAKIVFMTGGAYTEGAQKALAALPNPCVDKPFNLEEITALVREHSRGDAV